MNPVQTCSTCGKIIPSNQPVKILPDGTIFCKACADESGFPKRYSQIVREMSQFLQENMELNEEEAIKMAKDNIQKIPYWLEKQKMMDQTNAIVITDIGSTTTKSILIQLVEGKWQISEIQNVPTTVEKPVEDVTIGVERAVKKLEKVQQISILKKTDTKLAFNKSNAYFSTSSAGGGLQILVIGLTKFDTASSAERAAFGAGGVILDTFAIDDKRSALEQMQAMKMLKPDIILMAGGIDGGAIAPILRLGEILQIAEPKAKFTTSAKVPLIFAGNVDIHTYLEGLFHKKFDLHFVPNIRPTIQEENLLPAREKIHNLFMDNVMERAPGYLHIKKSVSDDIIPTPLGVMRSLQLISEEKDKNILCVDIGGATTDVFSNILGTFFRTVSANYGMSYSISNVLKAATYETIQCWISPTMDKTDALNYIADKMLYPTYTPNYDYEFIIEHAVGRAAIQMAKKQHFDMNFNTKKIGFLEKIKKQDIERLVEAFYIEKKEEKEKFHMYDFELIIGAGGIISHTRNKKQALSIILEGMRPQGVCEIWRDQYFISPHLGKLSEVKEDLAKKLLMKNCYEPLGIVFRPITKKWKDGMKLMKIDIHEGNEKKQSYDLHVDDFLYIDNHKNRKIEIHLAHQVYLNESVTTHFQFESDLPLVFDGRRSISFKVMNEAMKLYPETSEYDSIENTFSSMLQQKQVSSGIHQKEISLPYKGEIFSTLGDTVRPETTVGENRYDPPKIYIISLFEKTYLGLHSENIRESLTIHEGDKITYGQRIIQMGKSNLINDLRGIHKNFDSPVRGIVEKIHYSSGTIIIREVQDYTSKPKKINVAKILNIEPNMIKRHIKRKENDFIYSGELLASKMFDIKNNQERSMVTNSDYIVRLMDDLNSHSQKMPVMIPAPTTGTIKEINTETGIVTIQYDKEPYVKKSHLHGKIIAVEENRSVKLEFEGWKTQGIIGFGSEASGLLHFSDNLNDSPTDKIIIFPKKIRFEQLKHLAENKIAGLVCASIDYEELVQFTGEDIGVALTGNEKIPFPLILTEGFGNFPMQQELADFFSAKQDHWMYINGHTQIRAGVTRPEIIVQKVE